MTNLLKLFIPDLSWTKQYNQDTFRHDLIAGLISSLIIIPQAAALASLAGMPPQYGIYASIIPVIVAALWGSSRQSLTGPNTAVALMIAATIFPFANIGTTLFISLVLTLTFMVGVIQLVMASLKFGSLLKFVSPAVITGITNAVGVLIMVSAGWGLLGVHNMVEWHFITKINQLAHDIFLANPYAAGVGLFTLALGFALQRVTAKFYLVIAMFLGIGLSWILNLLVGSDNTRIEVLGNLVIHSFHFLAPNLKLEAAIIVQQLLLAAIAIAIVGALQASVIAQAISDRSGQLVDKNKELVGQGMSNVVGSFFMCFAGSSSFNRSLVHYESGAKTPLAAVLSSLLLIGFVFAGQAIIASMPISVMSAVLIMVGWRLIDKREFRRIFHLRSEAIIFYSTFFTALMFGLTDAVFLGMFASLFVYLKGVTNPNVALSEEDQGTRYVLQLRGHLFFATLTHLSRYIRDLMRADNKHRTLVIDLRDVTYIDWAAIRQLRQIGEEWRNNGGKFVLRLLENQTEKTLGIINHLDKVGGERQVA